MKKMLLAAGAAMLIAGAYVVLTSKASAQSAGGCPTAFTLASAGASNPADANLDGYVCQSDADVRPNGIVETMQVDNGIPPCGCPDSFLLFTLPSQADRNQDGWICRKTVVVGPPGATTLKFIDIDNNKCNP